MFGLASSQLGPIRDAARALLHTAETPGCLKRLEEIHLRLHSLTPASGAEVSGAAVSRLIVCLTGLVRKLIEKSQNRTPSAFSAVSNAVELLHDLVVDGEARKLASAKSFRMLVVDDDPIARRAMACALQMAFEKPECVENGEAALAAAGQMAYDVIFLDVQMPEMDGFEVCSKLRLSGPNAETPVVFVTSHGDEETREQAAACGGDDFIQKPFLTSEVTVKALTFALRARLPKPQMA